MCPLNTTCLTTSVMPKLSAEGRGEMMGGGEREREREWRRERERGSDNPKYLELTNNLSNSLLCPNIQIHL